MTEDNKNYNYTLFPFTEDGAMDDILMPEKPREGDLIVAEGCVWRLSKVQIDELYDDGKHYVANAEQVKERSDV